VRYAGVRKQLVRRLQALPARAKLRLAWSA